ncbi:MAG: dTDP-4-amino-4,6-dideoxygalactose transaminase [Isosphaeraceae bacterium]
MGVLNTVGPRLSSIPFNQPHIVGTELEYVTRVIQSGKIAGDGEFTRRCAQFLEERFGIRRVFMTPSCTAALELAAMLCDLGPGDEAIMPSFTFVSTANAIARTGARPVFVEVRPDTLNMDETKLEAAITPRTKAIVPVHYAGVACELDRIIEIAKRHDLTIIEDAAQGVNAYYKGGALGSFGHLGAYSFHETKNLVCGEGGALCCNDPALIERAEILRDKGTNRSKFFRGEVDKYTWVDIGSSYIPSELTCAFLYAQLEAMDEIKGHRREISETYVRGLRPLEDAGLLRLPRVPDYCESHFRTFYVLLNSKETRTGLIDELRRHGVSATFHFVPLHCSPMGARLGYKEGDLPLTEDLSERLLRLPCSMDITEEQQAEVIDLVTAFLVDHGEPIDPDRVIEGAAGLGSVRR